MLFSALSSICSSTEVGDCGCVEYDSFFAKTTSPFLFGSKMVGGLSKVCSRSFGISWPTLKEFPSLDWSSVTFCLPWQDSSCLELDFFPNLDNNQEKSFEPLSTETSQPISAEEYSIRDKKEL